ncbi:MAG: response regulator transcription factor [Chloroflexota bacterium]|nr:response regulator transcription factor [Chloroflexota bacterium]
MSEGVHPIRLLIADDHPIVRTGLRLMLQAANAFTLVGEAVNGVEALRLAGELQPDVVLMDLRMPGMDGIEAIRRLRGTWPHIAVIILTTYDEDDLVIRGLQAGACGYLLKDTDLDILLDAIRVAARGERLVQPEILERLLAQAARSLEASSAGPRLKGAELTAREQEVLAHVARGERSKEIALHLGLTERTIKAYLSTIYAKLGVDSRAAAVAIALEQGLL